MQKIKNKFFLFVIIFLTTFFISCTTNINVNNYIDKNIPFTLTTTNNTPTEIAVNSQTYKKIIEWNNRNTNDWKEAIGSYIADACISQNDFRLLLIANKTGVVIGFNDEEGKPRQYLKMIKKGELSFLLNDINYKP